MTIQLFEENLEMAVKHEVVRKLWRDVHYPVTESLRKLHKRTPDKEKAGRRHVALDKRKMDNTV